MLNKVSLLRKNPLTENNYEAANCDGKENKLIKTEPPPPPPPDNNEPQVHNKLNFIRKLDEDIAEIVAQYQVYLNRLLNSLTLRFYSKSARKRSV